MGNSPKTTLGGIILLLGVLFSQLGTFFDADPLTNPDWGMIAGAVGAFWAFLKARDNDVSSEKAGAQ